MPRKKAKVPVRQSFIGNVVEVKDRCLVYVDHRVEEGDEFDSVTVSTRPVVLRKGERGLCVKTRGSKLLVLIRGELLPIPRYDLRPCISA